MKDLKCDSSALAVVRAGCTFERVMAVEAWLFQEGILMRPSWGVQSEYNRKAETVGVNQPGTFLSVLTSG